jgi:hypothetical protein
MRSDQPTDPLIEALAELLIDEADRAEPDTQAPDTEPAVAETERHLRRVEARCGRIGRRKKESSCGRNRNGDPAGG